VVNKRTMHVVGGNQRLKVLRQLDIKEVQSVIVDLDDAHEKALNIALNKISGEWDLPLLKDLLLEIDTGEIDTEITGFDMAEIEELMNQFYVEELDEMPTLPDGDRENFQQMTFTLHDGQVELIQEALRLSKSLGPFESLNENSNGNALARICEIFITNHGNS